MVDGRYSYCGGGGDGGGDGGGGGEERSAAVQWFEKEKRMVEFGG